MRKSKLFQDASRVRESSIPFPIIDSDSSCVGMDELGSHPAFCSQHSNCVTEVSPGLWTLLMDDLDPQAHSDPPIIPIVISARFVVQSPAAVRGNLSSLVIYAQRAATSGDSNELSAVHVPLPLLIAYPTIFAGSVCLNADRPHPTLAVSLARPIVLSSIILLSLDAASFEYAFDQGRTATFEARLEKEAGIIREGDEISLRDGGRWKVAMAEPVLQGAALKGQTKLLVLPPVLEGENNEAVPPQLENGVSLLAMLPTDKEGGEDDFDIDETFLARSSLALPPLRSLATTPLTSTTTSLAHPRGHSFPLPRVAQRFPMNVSLGITPVPLRHPIPFPLLTPEPDGDEDDTPHIYLRTTDLVKLGLFSGDWALVSIAEGSEQCRLGRVFSGDANISFATQAQLGFVRYFPAFFPAYRYSTHTFSERSITGHLSPLFLYNLTPVPRQTVTLSLSLSPLRLSSPPVLPTATSVTVARIASPHTIHRAYLPLFLEGLKEHFQSRRRILKCGDLISVGIDEERARFSMVEGGGDDDDVDFPTSLPFGQPTAVVFFKVTDLEVDPPRSLPSSSQTWEERIAFGELGAYVDPSVTKMLQTGVVHSFVPDVGAFLGILDPSEFPLASAIVSGSAPASRLVDYVDSLRRPGASEYDLRLSVLVKGARGSGKRTLVREVARKTGFHLLEFDCFDLLAETDLKTEGYLRARIDKAISCAPCLLLLRNIDALAKKSQALETGQGEENLLPQLVVSTILRECSALACHGWKVTGFPTVILATTCDAEKLPAGALAAFKEEFSLDAPGEPERLSILRSLTSHATVAPDVSLQPLAVQTAALVAGDLVDLVRRACSSATERALSASQRPLIEIVQAGLSIMASDFNSALDKARSAYSESIGAPKIPNVTWDDVGGLAAVKSDILDTIQLPLEHPELFADGLKKRSGILLYGPPGTGKTLLAKAVATSCSLNFFSVKGPELLNMYIGESEANVRRVFQRARDAKPCVIFFDELDSVAPKRGNQGDSGGVMDRIVSQLLAELDGMAEGKGGTDVFVIGATNRPDLLDPALLRPGRFDRMLYLGVSDNHESQLKIIQALTRKFKLDPDTNLELIANLCPFNYTGADFYALCSDAMLKAMTRKAEEIDTKIAHINNLPPYSERVAKLTPQYYLAEIATPVEVAVLVSHRDFEAALAEIVPSVSQAEMAHYGRVQRQFSGVTLNSELKVGCPKA
ncbi:peroxin-6, partial [Phenoliferia sp. Uapishka_3]